jgi:hypothetical protein
MSAFNSLETGHPALATLESFSNVAWPAPGILALSVRWTAVMAYPPSTCLSVTSAEVIRIYQQQLCGDFE